MDRACHRCGESGHAAGRCRGGRASKPTGGMCYICGRSGHLRRDCPGVEDDGAGQSRFKGKSSARGKKREKNDSVQNTDPPLPAAAAPFVDMNCGADVFSKPLSDALQTSDFGDFFPHASFVGAVLSCSMNPQSFTIPSLDDVLSTEPCDLVAEAAAGGLVSHKIGGGDDIISKTCGRNLGYWAGVPPALAAAFLSHCKFEDDPAPHGDYFLNGIEAEHIFAALALRRYFSCHRVVGASVGLNYSPVAVLTKAEQLACLKLQLELISRMNARASTAFVCSLSDGVTGPRVKKAVLVSAVPAFEIRSISDMERLTVAGASIDQDLLKVLLDIFNTAELRLIPIVVQISSCGLQWATIQKLMESFTNCYFSIDCRLTHSKQKLLREFAFDLPMSKIILESNGPLYLPADYNEPSGSHPGHILVLVRALAEIKGGLDIDAVLEQCYVNTIAFFQALSDSSIID